ncbi:MAG: cytochrome b/b6 domain-containing protein [candidate division KSB1 bacterium]
MFRIISITGFVVAFASIAWAYRDKAEERGAMFAWWKEQFKTVGEALRKLFALRDLKSAIYRVSLLLFAILAFTGFAPVLLLGWHMSGVLMIVHVTLAPIFAVGAVALTLMYAQRQTFNQTDWDYFRQFVRRKLTNKNIFAAGMSFWKKASFWLLLLLTVPVLASVVLMMYPWFGTAGQHALLQWHRYGAFCLTLVLILHLYLITLEHARAGSK